MNRAENDKVIHFPVGTRRYRDMIMQISVPVETNKITPVGPLLKSIDASGYRPKSRSWSHLTPSASGGRRREIRKGKRLDYLMNFRETGPGGCLRENRRLPWKSLATLSSSARGRITKRSC